MIAEKEWYRPGEVIPTVYQLEHFVLPNLDELRLGVWPTDPRPTGYIDTGKSQRNLKAYFIDPGELAAEVDKRMSRIVDSIALVLHYTTEWPMPKIAQYLHYDELELWREMRLMLKFVAGYKRKRDSYPTWKAKYLHKKANKFIAKGLPIA